MAECSTLTQESPCTLKDISCDDELYVHPSHPSNMSAGDTKHKLNKKIGDAVLPNGVLRLSSESNGMINHSTEPQQNEIVCCGDRCQGCTDLHSCGCAKPNDVISKIEDDCQCSCADSYCQNTGISDLENDLRTLSTDDGTDLPEEPDVLLGIRYVVYTSETQMPDIMRLITKDLSEPYSIYTYRYFIHNWPKLCFLAMDGEKCVGAIVCKLDMHKKMARRGYIAMLAVDSEYRRKKIGSHLVLKAIKAMIRDDCDEVVLETEITNQAALRLYENLGFVRDKRLFRYYLNGVDALRLKLWLK